MDELERNVANASTRVSRWANVAVVPQAAENADTVTQSRAKWAKVYQLFGARGESEQDEVFAAANYYFLRNGASPRGKYSKPMRTAGGVEVEAGLVVKETGRLPGEIRQFLRGRLEDSYTFLKHNPAIKDDEALVTAAANAGIEKEYCWLMADWLGRDCPYFVGKEAEYYNKLRTSKIAAAYYKREFAKEEVDHVAENTPESKVAVKSNPGNGGFNQDLY